MNPKLIFVFIAAALSIVSCGSQSNEAVTAKALRQDSVPQEITYYEFVPKALKDVKIKGFDVQKAYEMDGYKIVSGYYEPVNGKIRLPDTDKDWGDRLLLVDSRNEIIYRSPGAGDAYLYIPHFYKNDSNDKIIVICQLAFEYYFGGDVFELEKGKVKFLGNLNIEVYDPDMEKFLADNIIIREKSQDLFFDFDADSLVLDPGGQKEEVIKNDSIRYVFDRKTSRLYEKRW